jgi:hypothetical protein
VKYITIKDADGELRPMRYINKEEWHGKDKLPKLNEGECFALVEIVERTIIG